MSSHRLVLQTRVWHAGPNCTEMVDRYYFLQTLVGDKWVTCPVVLFNELPEHEQEFLRAELKL